MTPPKKDTYWQIHDKFFKEMFICWSVIRSFTEQYLLPKIRETLNLDIITPIRNESVDQEFRVLFSDLIFEIETISGTPIYLLFEHRSQIDKSINEKLVKYMDTFELDYLKDHQDAKAPLYMIPVLVYHGLEKWTISVQRGRLENIVFFDLSSMSEEQIKGTPVLRIVLLTLKYIKSEEIFTKIDRILEIFKEIKGEPEMKEYVKSFTYYVEHAAKPELRNMLVQKMNHYFTDEELESSTVIRELEKIGEKRGEERGEKIGEERGKKKGEKKGEKKGIDIGANKGAYAAKLILTTRKDDEEIAIETGLAVEKIRELRELIE